MDFQFRNVSKSLLFSDPAQIEKYLLSTSSHLGGIKCLCLLRIWSKLLGKCWLEIHSNRMKIAKVQCLQIWRQLLCVNIVLQIYWVPTLGTFAAPPCSFLPKKPEVHKSCASSLSYTFKNGINSGIWSLFQHKMLQFPLFIWVTK